MESPHGIITKISFLWLSVGGEKEGKMFLKWVEVIYEGALLRRV